MSARDDRLELVQRELDGDLSPEESRLLAQWLAADPELRRARDELREVTALLDEAGEVEPPLGFGAEIAAAVRARTGRPATRRFPGRSSAARRIWAAAAGIVLGALGYHLVARQFAEVEPAAVSGSIANARAGAPFADLPLDAGGLRGRLAASAIPGGVRLDVDLAGEGAVVLAFDPAEVRVSEFARLAGGDAVVSSRPGELTLGPGRVRVLLDSAVGARLRCELRPRVGAPVGAGEVVLDGTGGPGR
ncbi:MAG: hypothetical protein KBD01_08545 [Acidobacteria bacterium]|nr:hypothetical protein [Acidobacteriota bacterium]